jgi:hypothetical protein
MSRVLHLAHNLDMPNCKIHTTMSQSPIYPSYPRSTPRSLEAHIASLIDSTTTKLIIAIGITALVYVVVQDDMYFYVYLAASLGTMVRLAWRTIWMWRAWADEREDEKEEYDNNLKGWKGMKRDEEMGLDKQAGTQNW